MSVGSKFFCVATRIEFDLLADPGGVSTFYQKFNGFLGVNSPMHAQRTSMNLLSQLLSAGCFNLEQPKRSCGLTLHYRPGLEGGKSLSFLRSATSATLSLMAEYKSSSHSSMSRRSAAPPANDGGGVSVRVLASVSAGGLNSSGWGTMIASRTEVPAGKTPAFPPFPSVRVTGKPVSVTRIIIDNDMPSDSVPADDGALGQLRPLAHSVVIVAFVKVLVGRVTFVATVPYHNRWM